MLCGSRAVLTIVATFLAPSAFGQQPTAPPPPFAPITISQSDYQSVQNWLGEQPAWAGLINPCNGLFHKGVKGKNRRPSFSTDTLNVILGSPLFTGFLDEANEHKPGPGSAVWMNSDTAL